MLVLDTCALVFLALAPERLSETAATAISEEQEADGILACADITLWELAMLIERGRIQPGVEAREFIELALAAGPVEVLPVTPAIACRSVALPVHGGPAARLIAATAIEHSAPLITADGRLLACPVVKTLW
jgi:PIN domain nuclease of toxin-antitoxin system